MVDPSARSRGCGQAGAMLLVLVGAGLFLGVAFVGGHARTAVVFLVIVTPLLFMLRLLAQLVREAYGFAEHDDDDLPPLRVCDRCNNTVLEPEHAHCPYCGAELPDDLTDAEGPSPV